MLVPQLFPAVTDMLPFCPADPVVTVNETVPCPDEIDHPAGTVQVYVVAFATALMLYTWLFNEGHCAIIPLMAPGMGGVEGDVL